MRSLNTISPSISSKLPPRWSIHSLLAVDLVLNDLPAPWRVILPRLGDFRASVPLLWPEELAGFLPRPAMALLSRQRAKVQTQWDVVQKVFPSITYEDYLEAWLVINTRSFYHSTPVTEQYDWEERLTLLPVADLLNHAETGCQVLFTDLEYTIMADRVYESGEEVSNSYGEHSNDFLLAEYGFILEENSWDEVCIDDAISTILSDEQKSRLRAEDLLDNLMLHRCKGVCDRARTVIQLLCAAPDDWEGVEFGKSCEASLEAQSTELLGRLLQTYLETVTHTINTLGASQIGQQGQRQLLVNRWLQVESIVQDAIMQSKSVGSNASR